MKQTLIWVGIGALVIIAGVYFISASKEGAMMEKDGDVTMEETKMEGDATSKDEGALMEDKKTEGDTMMKDDGAMMEASSTMKVQ